MRRLLAVITALLLVTFLAPGALGHEKRPDTDEEGERFEYEDDIRSENMRLVANWDDDGEFRAGTDLAFWGDIAVMGQFDSPGGFFLFDISDPEVPQLLSQVECPGPQNDVSIWGNLVLLSVDNARGDGEDYAAEECGAGDASRAQILAGDDWSGIRIFDISDPTDPEQIHTVRTDCGSHTHTLVPDLDNDRILVYVSSYPLRDQGPNCGADGHGKISVVEVPLDDPTSADVVSEPDVSPAVGCHDITVFMETNIAGAACISESQIWDISDPVNPEIISRIHNPSMNIHHSSIFSWDGEVLVLGDEMGGAAGAAGCLDHQGPSGALWFYDISDPENPELQSFYKIPEQKASVLCTAHQFNVVPLESDKRIMVAAWYNGGVHVLDFTDPANVERIGHYIAQDEPGHGSPWAAYWYNGYIYASNFDEGYVPPIPASRGFDVFQIDHPDLADHITLDYLNPYTQEPLPRAETAAHAADDEDVLAAPADDDAPLPATGGPLVLVLGALLALVAAVAVRRFGMR
jgi:hypothetical protein